MSAHIRFKNIQGWNTLFFVGAFVAASACSSDGRDDGDDGMDRDGVQDEGSAAKGGSGGSGGSGGRSGSGSARPDGGTSGGSGGSSGSGGSGADACGDPALNDCDAHATCTNTASGYECECNGPAWTGDGKSCACAEGYALVDGECLAEDGIACEADADCENANCIAEVCCASACDAPDQCRVAAEATCEDGATCVYANADDGTTCDDGNACTQNDACTEGACGGDALACDDGNVCTADSCDPQEGCVHDGSDITTAGCAPDDMCNMNYACAGNVRGDCVPADTVDCSALNGQCTQGVCDPANGSCQAMAISEGQQCNDSDVCTSGETCIGGSCQDGAATVCVDDGSPCTAEVCDAEAGCVSVPANENGSCDDGNPCTQTDACNAEGACVGSNPRSCASETDACNVGICNVLTGACEPQHRADGTACSDGNSCTTDDECLDGACTSGGNACGPNAMALPGGCTQGSPNTCNCVSGYEDNGAGECAPNEDECTPGNLCGTPSCGAHVESCSDLSSACGTRVCTCEDGYEWDGSACALDDPCAPNPCGQGTCAPGGTPGTYSCNCSSSYRAVDDPATADGESCVCDMDGTFALRIRSTLKWPRQVDAGTGVTTIEAGEAEIDTWAIRRHTGYAEDGSLVVETVPCGGTTPDICAPGIFLVHSDETYAQFITNQSWGSAGMPSDTHEWSLPDALPGDAFVTPDRAYLLGISLADRMGPWPASRENVLGGSGPRTNGAAWENNHDPDSRVAVTSYAVPPGGISDDNSVPDPPFDYGSSSSACPRGDASESWPYNYWPAPRWCGTLTLCRIARFQTGTRNINALEGVIESCDRITGDVTGPYDAPNCGEPNRPPCGQMQTEARIADCELSQNGGACSSWDESNPPDASADETAILEFLDEQPQVQEVMGASFVMTRVSDAITCDQVRAMSFE